MHSGDRTETCRRELSENLADQRKAIYRYILSMVGDIAEAEDLTQDTMLRAHKKLPTLKDPAKLLSWLYRIATNLCRDRFRQAAFRNRPQSLDRGPGRGADESRTDAVVGDAPRLDKAMEQEEMSACVQTYVAGLPDSYRAAILLHDCEGLTNAEVAEMLGVPLSTVKMRLHRARERLRAALRQACSFSTDERGVLVCEPKPKDPKQ